MAFEVVERVVVVHDLAGWARAFQTLDDVRSAELLQRYYGFAEAAIEAGGGTIVKTMGDCVLAVFPCDRVTDAIEAMVQLSAETALSLGFEGGANVHLTSLAQGQLFGRFDIVGSGVNHAFLMGRGPGLRISESVFRQLPIDQHGAWTEHRPQATYHLTP